MRELSDCYAKILYYNKYQIWKQSDILRCLLLENGMARNDWSCWNGKSAM